MEVFGLNIGGNASDLCPGKQRKRNLFWVEMCTNWKKYDFSDIHPLCLTNLTVVSRRLDKNDEHLIESIRKTLTEIHVNSLQYDGTGEGGMMLKELNGMVEVLDNSIRIPFLMHFEA